MNEIQNLFNTEKDIVSLNTDRDYELFFEKLAQHYTLTKFSELEAKVAELAGSEKLINNLNKFAEKLSLDRNRLKSIFDHE